MSTATQRLLDELARWHGDPKNAALPATDYRLALDYFRCQTNQVARWRTATSGFSPDRVLSICEDIWPGDDTKKARWLVEVQSDREQNVQVKTVWAKIAQQVAVLALVGIFWGSPVYAPDANASVGTEPFMYYALFVLLIWLIARYRQRCRFPSALLIVRRLARLCSDVMARTVAPPAPRLC